MNQYCFGALALLFLLAGAFLLMKRKYAEAVAFLVFSGVAGVMVWLP